jgi:hypothetical protein
MTWPDAVAQLTGARTRAETCVALVKKYGDAAHIDRGQLIYTNAKADADAVIAGLITALSTGKEPDSLSSLQTRLNGSVSGLVSTVDNFIRPWLVSLGAEMPLIVIFLGVLGGFIAFGFLGLFIGPTLLGVFYQLLQAWRNLPESPRS